MDIFATAISIALQHGVPLKLLCEKFAHSRFEPSGWSQHPDIGFAKSIMDYIFRWLQLRFLTGQQELLFKDLGKNMNWGPSAAPETLPPGGALPPSRETRSEETGAPLLKDRGVYHASDAMKEFVDLGDAPSCHVCGAIMTRNGSCYRCMSCGAT